MDLCRGVAKLVKAPDFDSGIRRFESFHPCQIYLALAADFKLKSRRGPFVSVFGLVSAVSDFRFAV